MVIGAFNRYSLEHLPDIIMTTGAFAQVIGYALEAPAPPFPVFVLGYAVNGFGLSLQVNTLSDLDFRFS